MIKRENIIDYLKEYEKLNVKLIERELKIPLDSNFILSIIGPRRVGKTYYLYSISKKVNNALYLNFEDSRLAEAKYFEIRDIIRIFIEVYGKEPKYLLLDEIQNIEKWEIIVRELYDLKRYKIIITGSSSKLLSREIATQLRGRTLSFLLLPFSFREYLRCKNIKLKRYKSKDDESKLKNLLRNYLEFGGFPDVVLNKEKLKILREYSDLVLFRDFVERHKIKNIELARFIHSFVIQNFSREISIKSLFNKIKVMNVRAAKDSIYEYTTKLEDTLFFFFLRRFSKKLHLRETWPKKIYTCDTGLSKIFRFSPDYGKLMENVVFLELLRKTNEKPLMEIYYWKDYQQREVDFVIKEGLRVKQLIQVCYDIEDFNTKEREVKSLIKVSKLLKCKNLLIITWDFEGNEKFKGENIRFIPLWKWLLS